MTMHICVECKHHRKEGRMGIRCHAGIVTRIVRSPVTGTTATVMDGPLPTPCEARREHHPDTCPDYKEQE
ncbi:hypothetical protein [Ralstonia pseudosolanacearum]|uniref:hypothetical protein n=1 Tax=Ralstonia pseudosolanacearum TaxID=1310165 RepID=UPI00397E8790